VEAYLGRGKTYAVMGQGKEAVIDFEKAISLQPNYWRAYNELGTYYYEVGAVDQALPYLEKVAGFSPESDTVFNNLGSTYYMLGQVEQASRAWSRSVDLSPSAETLSNLGSALFYSEEFTQAAQRYREAIGLSPDNFQYWGNLGEALRFVPDSEAERREAFEHAIELAVAVLEVNPNEAVPQAMLASYYAQLGLARLARSYLTRIQTAGDAQIHVLYYRAVALSLLGEHEVALDELTKAVRLGYPLRMLAMDANFMDLRQKPRFVDLLAEPAGLTRD